VAADTSSQINHHGVAFLLVVSFTTCQGFACAGPGSHRAQGANFEHFTPPMGALVLGATLSDIIFLSFFHFLYLSIKRLLYD
jgi:hypothetical protein